MDGIVVGTIVGAVGALVGTLVGAVLGMAVGSHNVKEQEQNRCEGGPSYRESQVPPT